MDDEAADFRVVLITVPDQGTAARLARTLLEARLVACASIIPGIESHYWWEGRIESSAECLLIAKSVADRIPALKGAVQKAHPYECPEILALPVVGGLAKYLAWVRESVDAGAG